MYTIHLDSFLSPSPPKLPCTLQLLTPFSFERDLFTEHYLKNRLRVAQGTEVAVFGDFPVGPTSFEGGKMQMHEAVLQSVKLQQSG